MAFWKHDKHVLVSLKLNLCLGRKLPPTGNLLCPMAWDEQVAKLLYTLRQFAFVKAGLVLGSWTTDGTFCHIRAVAPSVEQHLREEES